jgi:Asp-tRNA(Asn)/Glu-tRNA(Gln) amidotransferase A subunit family amidase
MEHNEKHKAISFYNPDAALQRAGELDKKRANGEKLGCLFGAPFCVKDGTLCADLFPSTGMSRRCFFWLKADFLSGAYRTHKCNY